MGYTILCVPKGRRSMLPIIFRKRLRPFLVWIALGVILTILGYEIAGVAKPGGLLLNDLIAFWATGRLNATGSNPYAPDQLLSLQKTVGGTRDEPERIWNPPWTLPLVTPFGMLSYSVGGALWLMGHLAIIFFCADCIWRFYGGPSRYRWLALMVSFAFYPTLYWVQNRQISGRSRDWTTLWTIASYLGINILAFDSSKRCILVFLVGPFANFGVLRCTQDHSGRESFKDFYFVSR